MSNSVKSELKCKLDRHIRSNGSKLFSSLNGEDIRQHFPISVGKILQIQSDIKSLRNNDCILDANKFFSPTHVLNLKRKLPSSTFQSTFHTFLAHDAKKMCYEREFTQKANMLRMGSKIMMNPSTFHFSRSPEKTSLVDYPWSSQFNKCCAIPMPHLFENSYSVDSGVVGMNALKISVTTQTSPSNFESSKYRRQRISRRFSSSSVLDNIKKSIIHVRRVASAERTRSTDPDPVRDSSDKPERMNNRPSIFVNQDSSLEKFNENYKEGIYSSLGVEFRFTGRFSDNSCLIECKRSSTHTQFGFFISKDKKGLFVSRIQSPEYVQKMKGLIEIQDRILEIQGVPGISLELASISGLIRGCHLATFRLKQQERL